MKKLLVLVAMMAVTAVASAYDFVPNEYGACTISDEVSTSKSVADAYNAAKGWLNSQGFAAMTVGADKPGEMFNYTVTLNTKNSYNPFAGQFVENLIFTITVNFEQGKVAFKLENIQIQEIYGGYGTSNKTTAIGQFVNNVNNAKKAVADAQASTTMTKKEKKKIAKENEDIIENGEETINKARTELNNRLEILKNAIR